MRLSKLGVAALVAICVAGSALALSVVRKDMVHQYTNGLKVGGSGGTLLKEITCTQVDNQDIGSAAADTAVTKAVTVTGVALTDALLSCTPVQDDAAFDEGNLSCFIEAADTVKLVYMADGTGGDPAATNDYVFCFVDL